MFVCMCHSVGAAIICCLKDVCLNSSVFFAVADSGGLERGLYYKHSKQKQHYFGLIRWSSLRNSISKQREVKERGETHGLPPVEPGSEEDNPEVLRCERDSYATC